MKRIWVYEYLSGGGALDGHWHDGTHDGTHSDALLAMGASMRDAMVSDLLQVPGCEVTAATCPRASDLPDGAVAVQPLPGEAPSDFVARQSAWHDAVWLVAPETDGLLAQLQRAVPAARWLGCDAASIALAGSKRATVARLAAQGVLTPMGFVGDATTRRWVTKPDDGAGAADTRLHADASAARDHARGTLCVEPWVEGAAMSLSLLCKPPQFELLSVNRQQIAIDGAGRVSFEGVAIDRQAGADAMFELVAGDVVRAMPGLRGFVGIDVVRHGTRGPVVIEVNPRLTCAYVGLSAALGRNLAAELIDV